MSEAQRISEKELTFRRLMMHDFPEYAVKCLKIRPKAGELSPLVLNKAQLYLHDKLEEQRKTLGKVRALILKGRQQGISTYIEARLYWRTTHRRGVRAFILTHEDAATKNLFEMASRYHEHCPELLRPHTGAANANELHFDLIDSGYRVGTAGTKAVGRSSTVQFFHGSEVGFWPHADDHAAGILQAVPDEPDTELLLESTANGVGNLFHRMWQQAEAGQSKYIAVFLPWWWQPEYTSSAVGFTATPQEHEYQQHAPDDITPAHLAWRRNKISEIGETLFKREYPANPTEAFETSGEDTYIPASMVLRARRTIVQRQNGFPLICGLDPAYMGNDRTVFAFRRGRRVYPSMTFSGKDNMEVAGLAVNLLRSGVWLPDEQTPTLITKMFIDIGGMPGIVDRLRELGYGKQIIAVNFGESAIRDTSYINKRAEMWGEFKQWLTETPCQIPDSDSLHADLTGVKFDYDSSGRLKLESKQRMRARGLRSPDEADAVVLTFALPVSSAAVAYAPIEQRELTDGFYF